MVYQTIMRLNILIVLCFNLTYVLSEENAPAFPYPIDIVYTWVDGYDAEWHAIKESFLAMLVSRFSWFNMSDDRDYHERLHSLQKALAAFDAMASNRYKDNEELRYSLRSIYKFAPFINHIYIVTMGQRPAWLADHPMITIVDHKEIFKNPHDLPTFNSHAIESNLHRIPQLSEYFIYFNDDVFLGAPVTPYDFFVDGHPNVLFEKSLSPSGPAIENETAYRRAWRNTNAFLDKHFKPESRFRLCHSAFAMRVSYIAAFEEAFPFIIEQNSSHKFRSDEDFNITNGLFQYYWLYHTKIVSKPLSNMMVTIRNDKRLKSTKRGLRALKKNRPATFCLQDTMDDESDITRALLREFLEEYYPEPAPWEK